MGREVYRVIELSGDHTLDDLCRVIISSFDFIDEPCMNFVWITECIVNTVINLLKTAENDQQK